MKIKLIQGNKGKLDRILQIKTDDYEQIDMLHLLFLLKVIARNEKALYWEAILKTGNFYFSDAISDILLYDSQFYPITTKYQLEKLSSKAQKLDEIMVEIERGLPNIEVEI